MAIIKRFRIRRQLSRKTPIVDFSKELAQLNRKWQDALESERAEIVEIYNKFYCKDGNFLTMDSANKAFAGSRLLTIKYTWGVVPA